MALTYEQEIVDRARRLSQDINDYFDEQKYKQFTDEYQMEEITDRYLMNVAVELLINEVKEMGIESDLTADDIIEDHTNLETLIAIRTKFDKENLYATLRALTIESLSDFLSVYEGISLPEDLYLELAPWLADKYMSDPMWSLIFHSIDTWYSTGYFADHLNEIKTMLTEHTDPNKAVVTDANVDSITRFLRIMEIRQNKLTVYVRELLKLFPDLDSKVLSKYIRNYDHQKLDNENLPLFAAYADVKPENEPAFVTKHHLTVNHHVEYWKDKHKLYTEFGIPMPVLTKEIGVMIILSLVLDELDSSTITASLTPLKDIADSEVYAFMKALAILDYNKMLTE